MQIPLIAGRLFSEAAGANAAPVILISASTAKRFWPGVNPIGKHIRRSGEKGWRTVIGVVADVKQFSLANQSPSSISGAIYMPYAQAVDGNGRIPVVMDLLVKTTTTEEQTAVPLRRIATNADPDVAVGRVVKLAILWEILSRVFVQRFGCFSASPRVLCHWRRSGFMP